MDTMVWAGHRKIGRGLSMAAVAVLWLTMVPSMPAAAEQQPQANGLWQKVSAKPSATRGAQRAEADAKRRSAYPLDNEGMKSLLGNAPQATVRSAAPTVVTLPHPDGGFERFALVDSPVMEAGLAALHPEIKTYAGKGIDDKTA